MFSCDQLQCVAMAAGFDDSSHESSHTMRLRGLEITAVLLGRRQVTYLKEGETVVNPRLNGWYIR